jgi:hypothetical protein
MTEYEFNKDSFKELQLGQAPPYLPSGLEEMYFDQAKPDETIDEFISRTELADLVGYNEKKHNWMKEYMKQTNTTKWR